MNTTLQDHNPDRLLHPLFPNDPERAHRPLIIAGPCSAESPEQMEQVASRLSRLGVHHFRAGVWKPRSKPGDFEGVGEPALEWLREIQRRYHLFVGTEVGTPDHARLALKYGLDFVWIGARTTTSPFAISEIAKALAGHDIAILVKNPLAPDSTLWLGAILRFLDQGLTRLAAIHRGFGVGANALLRNLPLWSEAQKLRDQLPSLPLLCDPSHIAGHRDLVPVIAHEALGRAYDGLVIEVHPDPPHALSDATQQLTPEQMAELLRTDTSTTSDPQQGELLHLRHAIDNVDEEIIRLLSERNRVVGEMALYKERHHLPYHQPEREATLYLSRAEMARLYGVSPELVRELYHLIHDHSIRLQHDDPTTPPDRE